jgi:hypothetical protein
MMSVRYRTELLRVKAPAAWANVTGLRQAKPSSRQSQAVCPTFAQTVRFSFRRASARRWIPAFIHSELIADSGSTCTDKIPHKNVDEPVMRLDGRELHELAAVLAGDWHGGLLTRRRLCHRKPQRLG